MPPVSRLVIPCALLLAGCAAPSTPGALQPAASASPVSLVGLFQPGKRWEYKLVQDASGALLAGTYTLEVTALKGGTATLRSTTVLNGAGPVVGNETIDTALSRPFSSLGQGQTAEVTVVATATEQVSVPAGTYQATRTTYHQGDAYGDRTIDQWVTPEVGLVRQQTGTRLSLGAGSGDSLNSTTVLELSAVH